jgi:hypothetical protein
MENSFVSKEHPNDDVWEEYVYGRLSEGNEAAVEEHLLVCGRCQDALAGVDEFIGLMKFETARFSSIDSSRSGVRAGMASAGALAAGCIGALLWFGSPGSPPQPVPVLLKSFRSGNAVSVNRAPARHPLDLTVASTAVPSSAQYRLDLVTSDGEPIWSGPAKPKNGVLSVHVGKMLGAGTYWVRLYSQAPELLAEYGLKLE